MSDETVACQFCGKATRGDATKMCDGCWEIHSRIRVRSLDVIENILASAKPLFIRKIRDEGYKSGEKDERSRSRSRPGYGDMGG